MNTIHRFNIQRLVGENKIAMSPEHKLLNVSLHLSGIPTLYAIVDPDVTKTAGTKIERDSGFMYEWHSYIKVK